MDHNRVVYYPEQARNVAAHDIPASTPFIKTCCMPTEGALPINIPVYNPVYYGSQVLSGAPGLVPQQPYVFAAPVKSNDAAYQGRPLIQPNMIHQNNGDALQVQQPTNASEPLNVTHYIWRQSKEEPGQLKQQGTFAKLRTLFNWDDSADIAVNQQNKVLKEQVNEKQEEVANQEEEKRNEENVEPVAPEVAQKVEQHPKTKKYPICGFFSSCCRPAEEYPGFENATTNVFHMNTLFRENTYTSESAPSFYQLQSVSRVPSIHSAASVPVAPVGNMGPQNTLLSQPSLIPQGSIMSQRSALIPQEGISHQTSIPAHATTNIYHLNTLFRENEPKMQPPMCFNFCYPRTSSISNEAIVNMPTITSQPSIPVAPVNNANCFSSCWGGNVYNANSGFISAQNSIPMQEVVSSNLPSQRSVVSGAPAVESLSNQFSAVNLHAATTEFTQEGQITGSGRMESATRLVAKENAVVDPVEQQTKPAASPMFFKLHAVEIHQFVPSPQAQVPEFIQKVNNQVNPGTPKYQHSYGLHRPNLFFNPNTTGMIAPVIRDVMGGVQEPIVPNIYSMNPDNSNQVIRLQTEESQITPRDLQQDKTQDKEESAREDEKQEASIQ